MLGCTSIATAPTASIDSVVSGFGKVVTTSSSALSTEEQAKPGVRRDEAVMFYIANGDDPANLTHGGKPRSFGNYICAGSGALRKARAFLDYANNYSSAATGITTPGADTFAGQWAKYKSLEGLPPTIDPPVPPKDTAKDEFDKCVTDIAGQISEKEKSRPSILDFPGHRASDTSDESLVAISAALEALKALRDALATAAKDGLKMVNAVQQRHRFNQFVSGQHEKFQAALGTDLNAQKLDDAWNRRKADSLWEPYATFSTMMDLDRTTQKLQIVETNARLRQELSTYDSLRAADSPSRIVKAIAEAETQMYQVAADDKVSLETVISVLSGIYSDVSTLQTDYQAVATKAAAAKKSLP
jgi:hypothetical protein